MENRLERLDLTQKLKQNRFVPIVSDISTGRLPDAPAVVDLDTTTACDLACPECISANVLNRGRFSNDRLIQVAEELVDLRVKGVVFIGGGEPLLHPATAQAIRILAKNGVRIGLTTNGTLLHRFQAALEDEIEWTRVSVDAGTTETYAIFRPTAAGVSRFPTVIENIALASKVARGSVGFSFLVIVRKSADRVVTNAAELAQAAKLARSLGCNYFECKAELTSDHFISEIDDDLRNLISRQLEEVSTLASCNFRIEISSSLRALLDKADRVQLKAYSRCMVANLRFTISPHGVYVCAYHRGNPSARLGDPTSESLKEIWARVPKLGIDPRRDCLFDCARHGQNLLLTGLRAGERYSPLDDSPDVFI